MATGRQEDETLAELDRLRAGLLADAALCASLAAIWRPDLFAARLAEAAAARGGRLDACQIEALLASRLDPVAVAGAPPPGWLPAGVVAAPGPPVVRWAFFGERRLAEPFYEDSLAAVAAQPFNRLFAFTTPLAELAPPADAAPLAGLVFHTSRCGSTLVSQMLAASDANVVVAEAAPLDAVVRLAAGLDEAGHAALLRAMALALGRTRGGGQQRAFLKLDSWHICAAPLFRAAFPATPWVFLYRDPVEVMVSLMRRPGMQVSPDHVAPSFLGIEPPGDGPAEDYVARVLAALCAAAAAAHRSGGGLLVNYSELPQAVAGRILPHFGAYASAGQLTAMEAAALRDAKQPANAFALDAGAKRAAATDAIRDAGARRLAGVYAELESIRTGARAA